ncbi:MAG TPA: aldose 1-epimerase family protein [Ruminiclostridium sp.]
MLKKSELDYIGHISQVGGLKRYKMLDGRAKGVEVIELNNTNGLVLTIIPDRCLDIFNLTYKGCPVSFISKTGLVSPFLYNPSEYEWLRSFGAGFLTTCGFTQVGEPCTYGGVHYGLHGLAANIPAENVRCEGKWMGEEYVMKVGGTVNQVKALKEDISLQRTITVSTGSDVLMIDDVITNNSSYKQPFMLLYHMNFGYPFINEQSDFVLPIKGTKGYNNYSNQRIQEYNVITPPDENYTEQTYFHDLFRNKEQDTSGFMIANKKKDPDIAVMVEYNTEVLDNFIQNKFLGKRDYFIAMEPCNNHIDGVLQEEKNKTLQYLSPGEEKNIKIKVTFLHGNSKIEGGRDKIKSGFLY